MYHRKVNIVCSNSFRKNEKYSIVIGVKVHQACNFIVAA